MKKIAINWQGFNWQGGQRTIGEFITALAQQINAVVSGIFEAELNADVDRMLGREAYKRGVSGSKLVSQGACPKCGSKRRTEMVRNGYRERRVLTATWGQLVVSLPRVRCQCGGSVPVTFHVCRAYQRFWTDMGTTIRQLATDGLSLRQIQAHLSDCLRSSVGLRTINEALHAMKQHVASPVASVAPVLLLDAIWLKVLTSTGEYRRDQLARRRPVKAKHKVAILVALAVWPESGRSEVLDWELASGEDAQSWQCLLDRLDARGVYRERGLALIIHDGGKGLEAALNRVYPHIPHQRCVFHKLRNVWQAVFVDEHLSRDQAFTLRLTIIRQAAAIFRAPDRQTALALLHAFRDQFGLSQPAVVATLDRDLSPSLAFFDLLERFPRWPVTRLRTTSLLERLNRRLRRIFRLACAFHSLLGLEAAIQRVLAPFLVS